MELLPTAPFPTTTALMAISRSSSSISELYRSRSLLVDRAAVGSLGQFNREAALAAAVIMYCTMNLEFPTIMSYRPFSCDVTGLARAIYKAVWCTAATYKYIECARVEALLFQFGH